MTAPPARIRQRNGFGLTALGLGLVGIALGRHAALTWFVVVPLGLLTLMFGSVGIGRARGSLVATGKSAVAGTVAGAVTLALGVGGTSAFLAGLNRLTAQLDDASVRPAPPLPPATTPTRPVTIGSVSWDQPYTFGTGVVVTVAAPTTTLPPVMHGMNRAITPTATQNVAGLGRRTVVITVTVTNGGSRTYPFNGSGFEPTATFDGRSLPAVVDPAHRFDTPPSAVVPPGGSNTFQMAYSLPTVPGDLRLEFRPDPGSGPGVVAGRA